MTADTAKQRKKEFAENLLKSYAFNEKILIKNPSRIFLKISICCVIVALFLGLYFDLIPPILHGFTYSLTLIAASLICATLLISLINEMGLDKEIGNAMYKQLPDIVCIHEPSVLYLQKAVSEKGFISERDLKHIRIFKLSVIEKLLGYSDKERFPKEDVLSLLRSINKA